MGSSHTAAGTTTACDSAATASLAAFSLPLIAYDIFIYFWQRLNTWLSKESTESARWSYCQCAPWRSVGRRAVPAPPAVADAAVMSLLRLVSKGTARVGDSKALLGAAVATREM